MCLMTIINIVVVFLPVIFHNFGVYCDTEESHYLGCYLRDRLFEHETGSGANANNVNTNNIGIPPVPNIASNAVASNSDALDLWFTPRGAPSDFTSTKCTTACKSDLFRYAGVFKNVNKLDCLCGSSYGRNGEGTCEKCLDDDSMWCGSDSSASIYDTGRKEPSPPQQIMLLHRGEKTLRISWVKPIAPNGPLTGYNVTAKGIYTYSLSSSTSQERSWRSSDSEEEIHLTGLTPGTQYSISVSAINSEGESVPVTVTMWTKLGVPDPPSPPRVIRQDSRTMTIEIKSSRNTKGPISAYRVAMVDGSRKSFLNKDRPAIWNDTVRGGYPHYIAAEFSPEEISQTGTKFVVGDGRRYGEFYNGPIPEGHWHPTLGIVSSMDGFTEMSYSSPSHAQHSEIDIISSDKKEKVLELERERERVEIIGTDTGIVVVLWVAIGLSAAVLTICVVAYTVLKLNLIPKRRRPPVTRTPPRRTENHQLQLTSSATRESSFSLSSDNQLCYTHGGFVNDEDVKSMCLEKLKQVWNVPRNFMDIPADDEGVELIGNGKYGPVYLSSLKTSGSPVTLYIVPGSSFKSKGGKKSTLEDPEKLYAHLDELIRIEPQHVNVVKLIGFMEDGDSILFAVEFGGVSLKSWLLHYRQFSEETKANPISPYSLLFCAMNIAEAMFHLQSFKITHGQLAACNVLITDIEVPKVTGFGMLQCNPPNEQRDYTRWNSAEQFHNRCVKSCDIWAFGILLWELATLGATPYHDIHGEDLQKRVGRGSRPTQVEVIGDSFYQVMLHCWQLDRDERPDFGRLSCSIYELLPQSVEHLFISPSFNYPPYIHGYEHIK